MLLPAAARAQVAAAERLCFDKTHMGDDKVIAACTVLIQSGQIAANKRAAAYWYRGLGYFIKDDNDRAIADYGEAIRLDPKHADLYISRGDVYADNGDYDRAIADYGAAIRLDPKNAEIYTRRGDVYADKGDRDRAIADYRAALKLDPDMTEARDELKRLGVRP